MTTSCAAPETAPVRTPREHGRIVQHCRGCSLHTDGAAPIVGDGPADARLVVIGSVPRPHEALQGRALAGAARNVLDSALLQVGLDPARVRFTTVLRCRPAEDREPRISEIKACVAHLKAELEMVSPEVVVTLGGFATSVLLGRSVPLERVAGYRLDILRGVTLVPTYHPLDAVRGVQQAGAALRRDLAVVKAVLDGRAGSAAQGSTPRSEEIAQG